MKKLKVLLTGASGLLGQTILRRGDAYPDIEWVATARTFPEFLKGVSSVVDVPFFSCDITQTDRLRDLIHHLKPQVILHTAAMTGVDACQLDKDACDRVNIDPLRVMSKYAKMHRAHIVYLSTDFVYDGALQGRFYKEGDTPNPLSYYGVSKWSGELLLSEELPKESVTILRTALVYGYVSGLRRSNFLLWAKENLERKDPIRVVTDQSRCPTLAEDLADLCLRVCEVRQGGVFHASGKDFMSVWEAIHILAEVAGLDTSKLIATKTADLRTPAIRPPETPLDIEKARRVLGYAPHDYREGVSKVLYAIGKQ